MSKATLKSLEYWNFKGEKHRKIDFGKETNIIAKNRGGKTTSFDAYLFLLANIDSSMNAGIAENKPYDSENNLIHNLETTVIGCFDLDGYELILEKKIKEVWKNKTSFENTIEYEINHAKCGTKKEFQAKLDSICNPDIMQLLIFPLSFFDKKYSTDKRRNFIAGLAEIQDTLKSAWLTKQLESININTLKKSLSGTIKKSKSDIEGNQHRIDELTNSLKTVDSAKAKTDIQKIESEIKELQNQLSNIKSSEVRNNAFYLSSQKRITELEGEKNNLIRLKNKLVSEFEINKEQKAAKYQSAIYTLSQDIEKEKRQIKKNESRIVEIDTERESIKKEAGILASTIFDEGSTICPTCSRAFEPEQINEIKENYNTNKVEGHQRLLKKTIALRGEKKKLELSVGALIDIINATDLKVEKNITSFGKIKNIQFDKMTEAQIKFLYAPEKVEETKQIIEKGFNTETFDIAIAKFKEEKPYESKSNDEKRAEITGQIDSKNKELITLREILSDEKNNVATKLRIKQIETDIKNAMISIQDCTDKLNEIGSYIESQMTATQNEVNKLFKFIKVSMFETLQNGNISDICEITANGVPFIALNTESKTNALIDLQNSIMKRYGVQFTCFIDNRESTHKIIDTDMQIVNQYHIPESEFTVNNDTNFNYIQYIKNL